MTPPHGREIIQRVRRSGAALGIDCRCFLLVGLVRSKGIRYARQREIVAIRMNLQIESQPIARSLGRSHFMHTADVDFDHARVIS